MPAPTDTGEAWFSEFWERLDENEDDRISAVRLLGQMFAHGLVHRNGDSLVGASNRLYLDAADQFLIRRIEDAAAAASAGEVDR